MTYVEAKVGRAPEKVTDSAGAVFAPLRLSPKDGRSAERMVYAYGPPKATQISQSAMYTCPVSGIPDWVWTLVGLWHECKQLGTLPLSGGLLAQPLIIRRAFTILESEWTVIERTLDRYNQAAAMGIAFGGGKK